MQIEGNTGCILSKKQVIIYKSAKKEGLRHLEEQLWTCLTAVSERYKSDCSICIWVSEIGAAPELRGLPIQGSGSDPSPFLSG